MPTAHTFTDKNRNCRTYHTVCDDENNNYSKILFHEIKWNVCNRIDITEIEAAWAEEIMQNIIDGYSQGDFEIIIHLESGEEESHWLNWKIMSVWDGEVQTKINN